MEIVTLSVDVVLVDVCCKRGNGFHFREEEEEEEEEEALVCAYGGVF